MPPGFFEAGAEAPHASTMVRVLPRNRFRSTPSTPAGTIPKFDSAE
jgi:hypothetical protein